MAGVVKDDLRVKGPEVVTSGNMLNCEPGWLVKAKLSKQKNWGTKGPMELINQCQLFSISIGIEFLFWYKKLPLN